MLRRRFKFVGASMITSLATIAAKGAIQRRPLTTICRRSWSALSPQLARRMVESGQVGSEPILNITTATAAAAAFACGAVGFFSQPLAALVTK